MTLDELLNTRSSRSDASLLGDCTAAELKAMHDALRRVWLRQKFSTERELFIWSFVGGASEDVPPLHSEILAQRAALTQRVDASADALRAALAALTAAKDALCLFEEEYASVR